MRIDDNSFHHTPATFEAGALWFLERLTLRLWPRIWLRALVARLAGKPITRCEAVEAEGLALAVARWTGRWLGVAVERLPFRLIDVRDEQGQLVRLRVAHQDLFELQREVLDDPAYQAIVDGLPDRLPAFLAKAMTTMSLSERGTLWRAAMVVQICRWRLRQLGVKTDQPPAARLLLERRPWMHAIDRYAAHQDLRVLEVPRARSVADQVKACASPRLVAWLRYLDDRRILKARGHRMAENRTGQPPQLAVEYYGHLNLDDPSRYSDLAFWQQSALPAQQVQVLFSIRRDPLDAEKLAQLRRVGLQPLALDPRAVTATEGPVFLRRPSTPSDAGFPVGAGLRPDDWRWLRCQAQRYTLDRAYWAALFRSQGTKVYVSWFKYTAAHCAIADGMRDAGGVMAVYQRSCESPSAEATVSMDIFFGFARMFAEVERLAGSVIPYYVVTGYLGDHRFATLREQARVVRQALQQRGAERIIAFSDENSHDDERWILGHTVTRANYTFLLERVLREPWLGLLIKPKVPSTLRKRLGPVAPLLAAAEATGRCRITGDGRLHNAVPPVGAALAADVMIHGHLFAATAGVESTLAGVPTLLIDREGWPTSPFYRLGVGRVVFRDWAALWHACLDHWRIPEGVPGFGDWSPMLDELDPFRDGRASERMGTYLQWLLDAFAAGRSRDAALAEAAERYAIAWGHDKVLSVNAGSMGPAGTTLDDHEVIMEARAHNGAP